jgi:hypothetical protein
VWFRKSFGRGEGAYRWWNDTRILCARYLVIVGQVERSGPIVAVLGAAVYVIEKEDKEKSIVGDEEAEEARTRVG